MNILGTTTLGRLMRLTIVALFGLGTSLAQGDLDIVHSTSYKLVASSLLFVGLYAAVLGINHAEAKKEWPVVLTAITLGVVCKYAIIFGIMFAVTRRWEYAVLAMAVAQIDPLSIAALQKDKRLGARTQVVLRMWASFDDPMTAIATPFLVMGVAAFASTTVQMPATFNAWLILASCVTVGILMATRALLMKAKYAQMLQFMAIIVIGVLTVASGFFPLAAFAGWFIRPAAIDAEAGTEAQQAKAEQRVTISTDLALAGATFLLGMLLANGVDWLGGSVLGIATFASQAIATIAVLAIASRIRMPNGRKSMPFTKHATWHLALSQQNGITAIILALNIEPYVPGSAAVVSFAIVVVNLINYTANRMFDRSNI